MAIDPRPHNLEDQNPANEKTPDGEVNAAASGCKPPSRNSGSPRRPFKSFLSSSTLHCARSLAKFTRFVGPGFLIAVAYIDPGNYATDVAAGADFKYALLFIVLMSNLFAILLQSLCIKLGSVTGLNLAENCRAHLPRWMVYILYVFAEAAIISTDIAEVCVLMDIICRVYVLMPDTGGWLRDSAESAWKHSLGSRMCNHSGGCILSAPLLATQRVDVGPALIRILRHGSCARRCDLLLHPTLPHQEPISRGGISGLPPVLCHCAIPRVSRRYCEVDCEASH